MGKRAEIPPGTLERVLVQSRRRCCLCAYIDGDWRQKRGQVAHLDGNPANPAFANLVWLCLDHHSEYDSRTSQHKNYQVQEVRSHRDRMYREITGVVARGIQSAEDVGVVPFVVATYLAKADAEAATVHLRNYTRVPGLVTEIIVRQRTLAWRWVGECPIGADEAKDSFPLAPWDEPDRLADEPEFEIEVTDLARVVTRRRTGVFSKVGAYWTRR